MQELRQEQEDQLRATIRENHKRLKDLPIDSPDFKECFAVLKDAAHRLNVMLAKKPRNIRSIKDLDLSGPEGNLLFAALVMLTQSESVTVLGKTINGCRTSPDEMLFHVKMLMRKMVLQQETDPQPWSGGEVECHLCTRSWVAAYPAEAEALECPNCGTMTPLNAPEHE